MSLLVFRLDFIDVIAFLEFLDVTLRADQHDLREVPVGLVLEARDLFACADGAADDRGLPGGVKGLDVKSAAFAENVMLHITHPLLAVKPLCLIGGLRSEADAQLFECAHIGFRENNSGVRVGIAQLGKLLHRHLCGGIGDG